MRGFRFKELAKDKKTKARVGEITTAHGVIQTPAFVPVGTQATVKSLTPDELSTLGVQLFFVNTYHAYLRPGLAVIRKFGGLHRFMHWDKPLITDSGGFQVFSLGAKRFINIAISESAVLDRERFTKKLVKKEALKEQVYPDDYRPIGELVKIDEDGVTFTSHWDGTKHRFTPEVSMEIQREHPELLTRNPDHRNQYGPCPFRDACLLHKLDPNLMLARDYVQAKKEEEIDEEEAA